MKAKEDEIARLKAEITILTHKEQDNLNRLRNVEEAGRQQLAVKENTIKTLQTQIQQLNAISTTLKQDASQQNKLHQDSSQEKTKEIARL